MENLKRAEDRYKDFDRAHGPLDRQDGGWQAAYWYRGQNDANISLRDTNLSTAIKGSIHLWRMLDARRFRLVQDLAVWSIKKLCEEKRFFRRQQPHGHPICVEIGSARPYAFKMWQEGNIVLVGLAEHVVLPMEEFLEMLLEAHQLPPNTEHMLKFWEQNGKAFPWANLPPELRWNVFEAMVEPREIDPWKCPVQGRRLHPFPYHASQLHPLFHALPDGSSDLQMALKTILHENTYCFKTPRSFLRFLDESPLSELRQIRRIKLELDHDDFMVLFGGGMHPGQKRYRGRLTYLQERDLGPLCLEEFIIHNRVSENMELYRYYGTPQEFGCYARAIEYICGQVAWWMKENTKKITLEGRWYRRSHQQLMNSLFTQAKASQWADKYFFRKVYESTVGDPKMQRVLEEEENEDEGGVHVPRSMRTFGPVSFDDDDDNNDATPLGQELEAELWPCRCYHPCEPNFIDVREPLSNWMPEEEE